MSDRVRIAQLGILVLLSSSFLSANPGEPAPGGEAFVCPKDYRLPAEVSRADTYKGMPFSEGEIARYEIRYFNALVGYGDLKVKKPARDQNAWHRVFHVEAKTGEWYKMIFVAHDQMQAYSRPGDFGVSRFYIEQNEGQMFGSRLQRKKWLEFDHIRCQVKERDVRVGKPEKNAVIDLAPGSIDAVSAIYRMRIEEYKIGQILRLPIYTSEKNWWLEALPIAYESRTVPAGTFDSVKLKLQTYLGQELQQRGDLYVWIDRKTKERPLVSIEGKIPLGSVVMNLVELKAGGSLPITNEPSKTPMPFPVMTPANRTHHLPRSDHRP